MLNLRRWSAGRADTHGYRRQQAGSVQTRTIVMEQRTDEEEPQVSEADLQAFAKVADSDISDAEAENNWYAEPVLIGLQDSIPDHSSPAARGRMNRASTSSELPTNRSYRSSTSSVAVQNQTRTASTNSVQRGSSGSVAGPIPAAYSSYQAPGPARDTSQIPLGGDQSDAFVRELIQLLQDSAADLATLPEPYLDGTYATPSSSMSQMQGSFASMNMGASSPQPSPQAPYQEPYQSQQAPYNPYASQSQPQTQPARNTAQPTSQPTSQGPTEESQCVVCLDQPRNAILYNCGHVCVCHPCGKQLIARKLRCPMCRAEIKDCIVLYK